MKQYSTKEKLADNNNQAQGNAGVNKSSATDKVKDSSKSKLTTADLKGKKVDGDPELESDQPVKQV